MLVLGHVSLWHTLLLAGAIIRLAQLRLPLLQPTEPVVSSELKGLAAFHRFDLLLQRRSLLEEDLLG